MEPLLLSPAGVRSCPALPSGSGGLSAGVTISVQTQNHRRKESCYLLVGYSCPRRNEQCLLEALLHWCNSEGAGAAVLIIPASVECQDVSGWIDHFLSSTATLV